MYHLSHHLSLKHQRGSYQSRKGTLVMAAPAQNAQGLTVPWTVALDQMAGHGWILLSSPRGGGEGAGQTPRCPPIILPSWYSHPCGIPPALFQGDPCDHDMAGMPHITSRLGYKRRCGFLSLCCSLSPGSLALGEASCHVLRTLGQPRGEAVRPVPGGAGQPPHR